MRTIRYIVWKDITAKAKWIDGQAGLDALNPDVRRCARNVVRACNPNDKGAMAAELHAFVRDGIRYRHDPSGVEEISDAAQVLDEGQGDCDDKIALFVALCRAVGVEARARPIVDKRGFEHVQAVTRFPFSDEHPNALTLHEEGDTLSRGWLIAELIVQQLPLGYGPGAADEVAFGKILT